ncbi:MAG: rRNA maturation RNase YbeY [Candidatus Binatia bacterium]
MSVHVVDEVEEVAGAPRGGSTPDPHLVSSTHGAESLATGAERIARAILACLSRDDDELSVVLVGDARMRELNSEWRSKDSPTDVLSFSQLEGDEVPAAGGATLLGDVVVSVDTLRRQAAEGGWRVEEELARLLLHGVLHLLGYDHELEEDAHRMRAEEGRLVRLLEAHGIDCAWEEDEA